MEIEAHRAAVPDAPWKDDGWLSLSMKRSLILAAEQGYEQFSWADKNTLVNRWSREYEKLYDMQYDKKMPSIVKKLTGQKPVHMLPFAKKRANRSRPGGLTRSVMGTPWRCSRTALSICLTGAAM